MTSGVHSVNAAVLFLLQDSDGKHRDFLTLVRRQTDREKQQYISQLKAQLGGREYVFTHTHDNHDVVTQRAFNVHF